MMGPLATKSKHTCHSTLCALQTALPLQNRPGRVVVPGLVVQGSHLSSFGVRNQEGRTSALEIRNGSRSSSAIAATTRLDLNRAQHPQHQQQHHHQQQPQEEQLWPSSDRYVRCTHPGCHRRHWGAHGAAGVLLVRISSTTTSSSSPTGAGQPVKVLLQQRGCGCQSEGMWAIPGGALDAGETPTHAALREACEEVSLPSGCAEGENPLVVLLGEMVSMDHGSWKYWTVIAQLRRPWEPRIPLGDVESLALEWVALDEVEGKVLHPGFKAAWPELRARIEG